MIIYLVRHCQAEYKQNKTSILEAEDLTSSGIKNAYEQAEKIGQSFTDKENVMMISSSFARCLHTAKIFLSYLTSHNFAGYDIKIKVNNSFDEVQNLNWSYYNALVVGGEHNLLADQGMVSIKIDPKKTNPQAYNHFEYFYFNAIEKIDRDYLISLPIWFFKTIIEFETAEAVNRRVLSFLSNFAVKKKKPDRLFIFTHAYLCLFPLDVLTNGKCLIFNPGDYLVLKLEDQKLFPAGFSGGYYPASETNLLLEFKKRLVNKTST